MKLELNERICKLCGETSTVFANDYSACLQHLNEYHKVEPSMMTIFDIELFAEND